MDLIWRSERKIKFDNFCHFVPIASRFLRAKIYLNKVFGYMVNYSFSNVGFIIISL